MHTLATPEVPFGADPRAATTGLLSALSVTINGRGSQAEQVSSKTLAAPHKWPP